MACGMARRTTGTSTKGNKISSKSAAPPPTTVISGTSWAAMGRGQDQWRSTVLWGRSNATSQRKLQDLRQGLRTILQTFIINQSVNQSINQSLNQAQQKQKAPQNIMETHFLAQNTTNKNKASSTRIVASWALLACQVSTSHTILPLSTCSSSGSENLWKLRKSGQWHWALSPGFGAKRYLLSASTSYHSLSLITCVDFGDERHVLLVSFSCQSPTVRQNSVPSLWFWRRTPCIKLSERIHAELQNHVNSTWTLHSYPG